MVLRLLRRGTPKRNIPTRVLVLGLDCASPHLVFDEFELPVMQRLRDAGTWGTLESSIPCITVPAWASMMSSRDPGVLGIYGFRNRADTSYDKMTVASASDVKVQRVWDILSDAGKTSVVIGVPQTYPPRPLNGHLVSGFPVPGTESAFTYPAIFKQEVLNLVPDYPFDVSDFRTDDKAALLQRIIDMTEKQFTLLKHVITRKPWDFFMHVNMGVDRIHHGFWRYHDPAHRLYDPGNPFRNAIRDYYRRVDAMIGSLLALAGDDVTVLIVSDHGVKRMDGGICLNEWLVQNGWLKLKTPPAEGQLTPFDEENVDWSQTRAWGSGGYYGRLSLNVAGREPQGIVAPEDYERERDALAAAVCALPGPNGEALATTAFRPEEIYQTVNGIAPDLLVYFGGLHWRSVGSLGHGRHFTLENDTGPDDANHDTHGLFILYEPQQRGAGRVEGHQLMDIAPTILDRMQVPVPAAMQGRIIAPTRTRN